MIADFASPRPGAAPVIHQPVILNASDKDARRISTSTSATSPTDASFADTVGPQHACLPQAGCAPACPDATFKRTSLVSLSSYSTPPPPPCNRPQIARYCLRLENSSALHLRIGPPAVWPRFARRLAPQAPLFRALLRSLPPITRRIRPPRSRSHRLLSAHAHRHPPRAAMASDHSRAKSPSPLMCLWSLRAAQRTTFTGSRILHHPRS